MDTNGIPHFASHQDSSASQNQRNSLPDIRTHGYPPSFDKKQQSPMTPSSAMPINGQAFNGQQRQNGLQFSRSPPQQQQQQGNQKNTKHVPCKFFRQGQCTAGASCPYSHNLETQMQPCQYFLNGTCKYGPKCALPHVDRSGRMIKGPGPVKNNNRQSSNGYIRNGRYSDQMPPGSYGQGGMAAQGMFPMNGHDDPFSNRMSAHADDSSLYLEDQLGSPISSHVGSPQNDNRFAMSPQLRGVSALDVPFPASFNSSDLSRVAKDGKKLGESVPASSRLGWNPITSMSPTLSPANHPAFGNLDSLALSDAGPSDTEKELASSPPGPVSRPLFPKHHPAARLRSEPQNISSSLPSFGAHRSVMVERLNGLGQPAADDTEEAELVPSSLKELLTDDEMSRRFVRNTEGGEASSRQSFSGVGSPPDSKLGSPKFGSSPGTGTSRYNAFFARQAEKDRDDETARIQPSAFGHVGSPLRKSSLSSGIRDTGSNSQFGSLSSSPATRAKMSSVSSLSEQLRQTQVSSNTGTSESSTGSRPVSMRGASISSPLSPWNNINSANIGTRGDRQVSNSTLGKERIEEEDCFFSMEDDTTKA